MLFDPVLQSLVADSEKFRGFYQTAARILLAGVVDQELGAKPQRGIFH